MAVQTHSTSVPAIPFGEIDKDLAAVKASLPTAGF